MIRQLTCKDCLGPFEASRSDARRCKPCRRLFDVERSARSRSNNPERARAVNRRWKEANRELVNKRRREGYAANLEKERKRKREHHRAWRYNITWDELVARFEQQAGCCAACGEAVTFERSVMDHDHACCPGPGSCGQCLRGLLCHRCNLVLGQASDNPKLLLRLVDYLEQGS